MFIARDQCYGEEGLFLGGGLLALEEQKKMQ